VNAFSQTWLVAIRDFRERATSRAFQLSTGITALLVGGFIVVPGFFIDDGPPTWDVGYVGTAPAVLEPAVAAAGSEAGTAVTVIPVADADAARSGVLDGTYDVAVDGHDILTGPNSPPELSALLAATAGALDVSQRAQEMGLDSADLESLLAAGRYQVVELEPPDEEEDGNRVVAFFGVVFLFVSIVTYGQWILIGVVEEKASRVVEVVLGAVRPHRLLTGKVVGIGALGLGQLLLVGTFAIVLASRSTNLELPEATGATALAIVVWFVLGFALYATAYAAAGSLVSRQEDAQNAAFPLTLVLMAAYFIASFSFTGDNVVLRVASLVPLTAPMTMPIRMATGDAAGWEVMLSLVLMVTSTWLLIRLAGRIYAGGLLRVGSRVKLREAWRGAEA
jgi:ABC-2 type transport system permease protein